MRRRIAAALLRCRAFVLSIFLTYTLSSAAGIVMVHSGSESALRKRDQVVRAAVTTDRSSIAYRSGDRVKAAVLDFAGNLLMAAVPQTVAGLGVVLPYFSVAYQGWIGGVVSVDREHRSRLRAPKGATYYLMVLVLQFTPFSLCIGAGVRFGVELYRANATAGWRLRDYHLPRPALGDVAAVYAVAAPLFLVASAFEFLSTWNVG